MSAFLFKRIGRPFRWGIAFSFFILALISPPGLQGRQQTDLSVLKNIKVQSDETRLSVEIECESFEGHRILNLQNPTRLVLDFLNQADVRTSRSIRVDNYGVSVIRIGMFDSTTARVVFDLENAGVPYEIQKTKRGLIVRFSHQPGSPDAPEPTRNPETPEAGLSLDARFENARSMAFDGDRVQARKILDSLLKENPDYHEIRIFLGRMLGWDNHFNDAREQLQIVLNREPDSIEAYVALTDIEIWSGDLQKALHICEEGLKRDPDNKELLTRKARILNRIKKDRSARLLLGLQKMLIPLIFILGVLTLIFFIILFSLHRATRSLQMRMQTKEE